jgi:integrase
MAKSRKHHGVYSIEGKRGVSYGIDYIHPQTLQRVKKILKGVSAEAKAAEIRAIELADAARGAINKAYGLKAQGKPMLFTDMLTAYEKWARENQKSGETVAHRVKPLKRAFAGKFLSDINPFMVEKYKAARVKEVAKQTVNKELIAGGQAYEKAIEWKRWEGKNPFTGTRYKVPKPKKPGALTPSEVEAIIAEVGHPVVRDMIAFAFYQGWCINEIRKLRWDDLDQDTGSAWVIDGKGGETARVPLGAEALEIVQRQERRGEYVFCKLKGDCYRSNLQDTIKNAAARAGVTLPKGKRWHAFRRTWATNFLQAGGDVESLRVQGRWRDSSMPLWYAEAADEGRRKEILSQMPKLNGRNVEEIRSVVNLNGRKD